MAGSNDVLEIGQIIAVLQRRLASINANWDGHGPDLMTPAELEAFKSEVLSFAQESGQFMFAVGAYGVGVSAVKAAGA
jgi:hypothetical protein